MAGMEEYCELSREEIEERVRQQIETEYPGGITNPETRRKMLGTNRDRYLHFAKFYLEMIKDFENLDKILGYIVDVHDSEHPKFRRNRKIRDKGG